MKPFHIFKAGKHIAKDGRVLEFSDAQLKAAAEAYDPKVFAAQIVVGHVKEADPSYGEVQSLSFAEGDLEATPRDLEPEFSEMVRLKRFPNRSASFYLPDAPNNPVPGVMYLRHVAFLGAMPPAIKGLRPVEFAADETGVVEFADWGDMRTASMFRGLRDWILAKFGQEDADKALPGYSVDAAQIDAAMQPDPDTPSAISYSEEETRLNTQIKEAQAKLDADRKKLDSDLVEFAESQKKIADGKRRAEIVEFSDGLVKAAKLPKAHRDGFVEFMCGYPDSGVVEFGEGEKKVSTPGIAWFKTLFASAKPAVEFAEVGAGDGSTAGLDTDPVALAAHAVEFQEAEAAAGRTVDIATAITHVQKHGPKSAAQKVIAKAA